MAKENKKIKAAKKAAQREANAAEINIANEQKMVEESTTETKRATEKKAERAANLANTKKMVEESTAEQKRTAVRAAKKAERAANKAASIKVAETTNPDLKAVTEEMNKNVAVRTVKQVTYRTRNAIKSLKFW